MLVKDAIAQLQNLNADEEIIFAYWDKNEIEAMNGIAISLDVWASVSDHDYDWQHINEQIENVVDGYADEENDDLT